MKNMLNMKENWLLKTGDYNVGEIEKVGNLQTSYIHRSEKVGWGYV